MPAKSATGSPTAEEMLAMAEGTPDDSPETVEPDELPKAEVPSLGRFTLTTVEEEPEYLKILIYGEPGVGKTVLAGSASEVADMSPVLYIDIEGGTMPLSVMYPKIVKNKEQITGIKQIEDLYNELRFMNHPYQTVVIDSLSELQKISMASIMADVVKADRSRDPDVPSQREWGKNIEQVRRIVRYYRDLPMHVIMISHDKEIENDKRAVTKQTVSMPGKLAKEIPGFFSTVAFMYVQQVRGKPRRMLQTRQSGVVVAKDRTCRLPAFITDPTMEKLWSYVSGEVAATASGDDSDE